MNKITKIWLTIVVSIFTAGALAIPMSFIDLGNIGAAGDYTFDTEGSTNGLGNADTELGLWNEAGTLLDANDDNGAGGLWSEITATLGAGTYFIGISEFISDFQDGFINAGTGVEPDDDITGLLNINGALAGSGAVTDTLDQETLFFGFTVGSTSVPEPTTLLLLGAGLAAFGFSRRK